MRSSGKLSGIAAAVTGSGGARERDLNALLFRLSMDRETIVNMAKKSGAGNGGDSAMAQKAPAPSTTTPSKGEEQDQWQARSAPPSKGGEASMSQGKLVGNGASQGKRPRLNKVVRPAAVSASPSASASTASHSSAAEVMAKYEEISAELKKAAEERKAILDGFAELRAALLPSSKSGVGGGGEQLAA